MGWLAQVVVCFGLVGWVFLMLVEHILCFRGICKVLEAQDTCMITHVSHVSGVIALLVLALLC